MASLGSTSAGARTAAQLLTGALAASTADRYGRRWDAFVSFWRANGWSPLPAPAAAVACYFGVLCERRVTPSSLQGYLSPINSRHVDAGFPKPEIGPIISRLCAGYHRLLADEAQEFPAARTYIPAPLMWRIALLAAAEPSHSWATRWTACVWQFVLARRSAEILSLELRDIRLLPPGGVAVQVRRFKGGERRAIMERLTLCVPAAPAGVPHDLAMELLLRLLARLQRERAPPSRLIFSVPELDRAPTAGDLTSWLLVAVARVGARPPPGALYSSYSCRSGGATALHVCGVSRPGIARMLGHSRNDPAVADAHYVDALAPASMEAYWLVGRYTLSPPAFVAASHAPSLGQSAVSRAA